MKRTTTTTGSRGGLFFNSIACFIFYPIVVVDGEEKQTLCLYGEDKSPLCFIRILFSLLFLIDVYLSVTWTYENIDRRINDDTDRRALPCGPE